MPQIRAEQSHHDNHTIKRENGIAISKYIKQGFTMINWQNHSNFELVWRNNRCRIYLSTDDVLAVPVDMPIVTYLPAEQPLHSAFAWSLGGYPCGDVNFLSQYTAHVPFLDIDEDEDAPYHGVVSNLLSSAPVGVLPALVCFCTPYIIPHYQFHQEMTVDCVL